jgi:tRNA pseudouridine13 synthase
MERYASGSPPCPARLKKDPEDFRVEEALTDVEIRVEPGPGLLPLYRVEKWSLDTLHLERELASVLKSRVSFGGLKDKRAVAVQFATPTSSRAQRPPLIQGAKYRAELVGFVDRPLSRAMIAENRFQLVLRDCCPDIGERIEEVFRLAVARKVPNYYGLQRFGSGGTLTHRVGRAILTRRFDEAVRTLLCEPRPSDDETAARAREAMAEGKYLEGSRLLPGGQDIEKMVARRLADKCEDHIGALRAVPIRLRRLFTDAYQSYLFNRALSSALERGLDISTSEAGDNWGEVSEDGLILRRVHGVREPRVPDAVPLFQLPGFIFRDYGSRFDACLKEVMDSEEVAARDFWVEDMQEVSVEGGFRRPHMAAKELWYEAGGGVARLRFTLARGEYATVLVREIVKPTDSKGQGFA